MSTTGAASTASWNKVADGLRPVADTIGKGVRSGLSKVGDALGDDGEKAVSAELLAQTDLPELGADDALVSLAARLDREADLWRGVAMRMFGRVAWTERLSVLSAFVLVIGAAVLAAIAGFRGLFSTGGGGATAILAGAGVAILAFAAIIVAYLTSRVRKSQVEAQRDALHRADLAETRLHRIALLLELRRQDKDGYADALRGLEKEVRAAAS